MSEGQVQQPNEAAANEGAASEGATTRAPANETKADKFRRLVKDRVPKVSERFAMVMQLFEPKNYQYTEDQVTTIFDAFEKLIKEGRAEALAKLAPEKEKNYGIDLSNS